MTSTITRVPKPKKARDRNSVAWRFTIGAELDADQTRVLAHRFLAGTKHHALLQAYLGFGTTVFEGDYWTAKGREDDLAAVADRWDLVATDFPELVVDAVIEYRVPEALQDERVIEVEVPAQ